MTVLFTTIPEWPLDSIPANLERLQRRIEVVLCDNCYERREPREYDPDF